MNIGYNKDKVALPDKVRAPQVNNVTFLDLTVK